MERLTGLNMMIYVPLLLILSKTNPKCSVYQGIETLTVCVNHGIVKENGISDITTLYVACSRLRDGRVREIEKARTRN